MAQRSAQKRIAIYLRVSTGEQTTENQRRELEEVATRHGWRVVEFFEREGADAWYTHSAEELLPPAKQPANH